MISHVAVGCQISQICSPSGAGVGAMVQDSGSACVVAAAVGMAVPCTESTHMQQALILLCGLPLSTKVCFCHMCYAYTVVLLLVYQHTLLLQAKLWTCCVSDNISSVWCSRTYSTSVHAGTSAASWHVPGCKQILAQTYTRSHF